MKKILLPILFSISIFTINAQIRVPFTQRTSTYSPNQKIYNIKGDFQMIGNTNLTLQAYGDNTSNSSNMVYVDVDNDPQTLNSSTAELTFSTENGAIPACSEIIYAGLYWTGRAHDGTSPNTFSVTKTMAGAGTPITVNNNQTPGNNTAITYTTYTLTITRSGSNNNRTITYIFTPTGAGNTVSFIYAYNSGNPTLQVQVGTGTATTVTTSSINASDATLTTPYTIYDEGSGGVKLTVSKFHRNGRNADTTDATATTNVSGTYAPSASVTKNYDKSVVYLKYQGETGYTTISASDISFTKNIYYPTSSDGYMYAAYAEVTDYVKQHGIGSYSVADIALREGNGGNTGFYGGWAMVVVYGNSKMKWRDVTIFDGLAYINDEQNSDVMTYYELPVSGFHTAQNGTVNMKVGIIAGEGDRGIGGETNNVDNFSIRSHDDTSWIPLSTANNPVNNFFASAIVTSGTRNPSLYNNTGLDIVNVDVPTAALTNNQTSTKFRYGTNQDTYIIPCIAMAVDAYVPDLQAFISIGSINGEPYGGTNIEALPNGEMEYTLDLKNPGNERILNAAINIPIPYTSKFVSSSATYYAGTGDPSPQQPTFVNSGATGYLQWNIGTIPKPTDPNTLLAQLKFTLKATDDCFLLVNDDCHPTVALVGASSGVGELSGSSFENLKFIQGYKDGVCQGEPIIGPLAIPIDATDFVNANCAAFVADPSLIIKTFEYCQPQSGPIPYNDIAGFFPQGSRFYNKIDQYTDAGTGVTYVEPAEDAVEYTSTNSFPATLAVSTYYALPPGVSTCWWEFKIDVKKCNLWFGSTDPVTGSQWGNTANWTDNRIPAEGEDIIFATVGNYTVGAGNDLVLDTDRKIGKLVNESSKALIIPTAKTLTVNGTAVTNAAERLKLQANFGEANGAIVFNTPSDNPAVLATVEFASKSEPATGKYPRSWQYFGTPVKNRTLTDLFGSNVQGSIYGGDATVNSIVRKYNEALNLSWSYQEKWEDVNPTDMILPYSGYEVTQPTTGGKKYSFQGPLVADVQNTVNLPMSPVGVFSRGNYVLANPYAAPIFIQNMQATDFNNLEQTIYLYNSGSRQQWIDNGGATTPSDNLPGTYTAIPINTATTLGTTQISSLQGFLVTYDVVGNSGFTFRYATTYRPSGSSTPNEPMRIHKENTPEKSANADIKPLVTIDITGASSQDRVYLITAEGTTKEFDNGWDASKFLMSNTAQLYVIDSNGRRLQVSTDSDLNDTYLGVRGGGESSCDLKFHLYNTENTYNRIYIQDLSNNSIQEITDGMSINFIPNTTEKRFKLTTFKIITSNPPIGTSNTLTLKIAQNVLTISNSSNETGRYRIHDVAGREILSGDFGKGTTTVSLSGINKGAYIIQTATKIDNALLKALIK